MNSNDLVSIIVPVYGVEAYLPRCVDSLLGQTVTNLEVILVDDQSPDRCGEICDAYARKDPRVKVIHQKNGGAASARNAGLDRAGGAYICFVDSDDVVEKTYVEELLSCLKGQEADVAVCGFTILTQEDNRPQPKEPDGCYTGREYLAQFLQNWTCALIWNKLYRAETIGQVRFAQGHRIDDEFFTYQVILNSTRVAVFDRPLYAYRQRRSSVMKDDGPHRQQMLLDRVEYLQQRLEHVSRQAPELRDLFFQDLLDSFVGIWGQCRGMPGVEQAVSRWVRGSLGAILTCGMAGRRKAACLVALLRPAGAQREESGPLGNSQAYFP